MRGAKTAMPHAYWPKSFAEKRLKEIAKRLGGKISVDFSGIVLHGKNILYRHNRGYYQVTRGRKYGRWCWKVPFGREEDWRKVDFVLLHGPAFGEFNESFFLFTVREAARLGRAWPDQLNIGADPRVMRGERDKIWKHRVTLTELRRKFSD